MSEEKGKVTTYTPQPGLQYKYCASNLDVVFAGGSMNSGKSFATILSVAEPLLDPNFRAVFLRRNLQETKVAGGLLQDMKKVYSGIYTSVKESDNPRMTFSNNSFIDFTHISDENPTNLVERIKGWQYDLIYFDEGTSYEWSTFRLLFSRNRGTAKWTGKIRLTTNPKKNHWIRTFIDDYIGADGYIKPDWDGRVRYFYIKGKDVESVVWGDTKEEVYQKCKYDIDEALVKFKDVTYESLIKSFTFYLGSTAENKASIGANAGYLGSVAAMGEVERKQNLLGNWNVTLEDDEIPLPYSIAESVFSNDPRENGDKWITADLADTGTDNTMIWVWNGLHIIDYKIICKSTPAMNVEYLKLMASKHDIPDNHIIYDAIRAAYVYDYIPDAIGFKSYSRTLANSKYGRMYFNLKDDCYARMVEVITRRLLSFDDEIANSKYIHLKLKNDISIKTEFIEECSVVKFKDLPGGKKTLLNKKEMNQQLGKGRSMDLLDPIAMRMLPLLIYEYGQELIETEVCREEKKDTDGQRVNVYREDTWC